MSEYTEFCVSELRKALRLVCSKFEWAEGEKTIEGAEFTTRVDVYGEDNGRVVLIQFEMHRRNSQDNALKLFQLLEGSQDIYPWKGKRVLIIHIFSPFYEVAPHRNQLKGCEAIMPEKFESIGVTYQTFRWNLDRFCKVCKACLALPDSKNDFPPSAQLDKAISTLGKDLGRIINKWVT